MFRLLHVCTGNICRSPMAERLAQARLAARSASDAFVVESAGTRGLSGSPMDPASQRTLQAYGLDGSDLRARQLTGYHVDEADLVLCATREHRAVAGHAGACRSGAVLHAARVRTPVRSGPAGGLPGGDLGERARVLVLLAAGRRGTAPPADPRSDDLVDPYRAAAPAFTACAELIDHCLLRPLDLIAGPVAA